MKVVVSGYVGKKITGLGRNLLSLLENTTNIDFVVYINYDMKQDFVINKKNVTIKTYNVSKENSMKNLMWTTFVFPKIVKKENADLALIPNFTLLLFKPVPTIVIMHDLIEFNVKHKFSKLKMFYRTKLADPITAKKADKIITVSNNSKKDIIKFLKVKSDKIEVIYNGVDQNIFHKLSDEEIIEFKKTKNLSSGYILYVGTIDNPGKNSITLIKSYIHLRENGLYFGKLVLCGMPGSGYDDVFNYANSSKFKNDIIFTGYVSDSELVFYYNSCDVFCFLSLYEGFGIPPLEAISCHAKTIVSNSSSLPEVVGNIGLTVNPTDYLAVSNSILKIINQNVNDEKIIRHLENYSWTNLSKKFENVLFTTFNEEAK